MTMTDDTPTLETLVRRLAQQRADAATRREKLTQKVKVFEQSIAVETAALKAAEDLAKQTEAECKALAQIEYERTKVKALFGGVKVQETETVTITDPAAALAWAKAANVGVVPETYDEKALLAVAKTTPMPWATKETGLRATIPTDLSKLLADEALVDFPPIREAA